MPRLLIGVLLSTAPLVYWFLWRRSVLRSMKVRGEGAQANSDQTPVEAIVVTTPDPDHAASFDIDVRSSDEAEPNASVESTASVFVEIVPDVRWEAREVDVERPGHSPDRMAPGDSVAVASVVQAVTDELYPQHEEEVFDARPFYQDFSNNNPPTITVEVAESAVIEAVGEFADDTTVQVVTEPESRYSTFATLKDTASTTVNIFDKSAVQPIVKEDIAETSSQSTGVLEEVTDRVPQRYRPPVQRPPRAVPARPKSQEAGSSTTSSMPLEIRLRITLDRVGYCQLGFLPERNTTLDNEVTVKVGGTVLMLVAQEDWYEDIHFSNIGLYLRQGLELKGTLTDQRRVRWLLTGRDLYVLASHPSASGYVSTNRVVLGRSHIVLCGTEVLPAVETILTEAGCVNYTRLSESDGIPSGWTGLRGVSPTTAIPLQSDDPFYAIKPAPDIEIEIEGGISLGASTWLAGFPPRIKLLGEYNGAVNVQIDGQTAELTPDGFLKIEGSELVGQHTVYCDGLTLSRTYSIKEPPDTWEEWAAFRFGQVEICGPLVRIEPGTAATSPVVVLQSNPLLIGAHPGQIFRCSLRRGLRWKGYAPFEVVWALPATPLIANKKIARILSVSDSVCRPASVPPKSTKQVLDWCVAILDASRKGLRVEGGSPDATAHWGEYKKVARSIWRAAR